MSFENCEKYLDQLLSEDTLPPEIAQHVKDCPSCAKVRENAILLKKEDSVYPLPEPKFIKQTAEKLASNWKLNVPDASSARNFVFPTLLFLIGAAGAGWLYLKTVSGVAHSNPPQVRQVAPESEKLSTVASGNRILNQAAKVENGQTNTASQSKPVASPFEENVGK
ncbi:MAG: hypothetical protein HQM08_27945 [Candidatus Riflebacteria bacterium]|nr:hypothetical protein [Candidatus Riflebacteria bacterium]